MFVNACHERDELGRGQFRSTIALKPVAYADKGTYKRNVLAYENKGGLALPMVLDRAPLIAQVATDSTARMCPVRDDPAAFVQFGKPLFDGKATASLSTADVSKQQSVAWQTEYYDMEWLHAGHYASWLMTTRKNWAIPASIRFPVTVTGLKREGDKFTYNGAPAGSLRAPTAHPVGDEMGIVQLPHVWDKTGLVIDTSALKSGEWVIDPTLVLQPDAAAGKDTTVSYGSVGTNYGVAVRMFLFGAPASLAKGLLEFDLSSIVAGCTCDSATLELAHYTNGAANDWTTSVYSIAVGNQAWPEGTRNATIGGAGDSCWSYLDQGGAGTPWAGSAGLSTAITDYESAALGSFSGNRSDAVGVRYTTTLITARVAGWFGTPNTNYGLLLVVTSGGTSGYTGDACSSDHATAAYWPKLTVDYTLAGGGGIFVSGVFYSGIIDGGIVRC